MALPSLKVVGGTDTATAGSPAAQASGQKAQIQDAMKAGVGGAEPPAPTKGLEPSLEHLEQVVENKEEDRIEARHEHVAKEFSRHLLASVFDNLETFFGPQGALLGILHHYVHPISGQSSSSSVVSHLISSAPASPRNWVATGVASGMTFSAMSSVSRLSTISSTFSTGMMTYSSS